MLKTIKHYAVHIFGLTLSLSAIYHTMTQFSDDPIFKLYFGIGGVFAGLSIQYLRGLAAAYRKRGKKYDNKKALGFWAVVVLCICIFDFLSAFGIAVTQIDKGEQQYNILADTKREIEADIKTLEADIQAKKGQQEAEFKDNKGRGPQYDKFEKEIVAKQVQIDAKKAKADKLKAQMAVLKKSIFARLSEKSNIPSFWIEFVMFAGLMFLIYFVPLLTPWNIPLKDETKGTVTGNVTPPDTKQPEKPRKFKPVTVKALHSETAVTGEHVTGEMIKCKCGCGQEFPAGNNREYFNGNCRTRHSRALERERKEQERIAQIKSEGVRVFT
jgi:hypothetical protein